MPERPSPRSLSQRLSDGVILGAEGYVFELERRGYIKAGPFVPEVILDAPEAVLELHREFLRAGADVMVALTYYAHREKLRVVGRDGDLEAMNRAAVQMANQVAREGGALVAANICNTWSYDPADARRTGAIVRAQYEEQLGWAVQEGVDFVIARNQRLSRRGAHRARGRPRARTSGHGHVRDCRAGTNLRRLSLRRGLPRGGRGGRHDRWAELLARAGHHGTAAVAHPVSGGLRGGGSTGSVSHFRAGSGVRVAHAARRRPRVPHRARALLVLAV